MAEPAALWQALADASRVRWAAVLIAAAFAARLPVFFVTFASGDEATYCALARALLEGHRLYAEAADHKPPMLALTYAAVLAFSGGGGIHLVHALSILVVCMTAGLISAVAGRLAMPAAERRAAALVYVLSASTGPYKDMLAANGEIFMALPALAALLTAWPQAQSKNPEKVSAGRWLGAGTLVAIAALFKYQALAILAPVALLATGSGRRMRSFGIRIAWLAAGVGLPLAAIVGWYNHAGDLDSILFWMWVYPLSYAGMLPAAAVATNALTQSVRWGLLSAGLILLAAVGWRRAGDRGDVVHGRVPLKVLTAVWLATAAAGVAAGGRFYLHYYLQLLPPLCLLAARGLGYAAAGRRTSRPQRLALVLILAALAGSWGVNMNSARFHPQREAADGAYRAIAEFVAAQSEPFERLFVWGNSPEIYYYAERSMGTRFAFCNYLSGKIWGTPADQPGGIIDPALVVQPAWEMLWFDLSHRRPDWIVDAAAAGLDRWQGHAIDRYPLLAEEIARHYRRLATVAGADIYMRLERSDRENPSP